MPAFFHFGFGKRDIAFKSRPTPSLPITRAGRTPSLPRHLRARTNRLGLRDELTRIMGASQANDPPESR
jgi:hypothetical protein